MSRRLLCITSTRESSELMGDTPGTHSNQVGRLPEPGEGSWVAGVLCFLLLQLPGGSLGTHDGKRLCKI